MVQVRFEFRQTLKKKGTNRMKNKTLITVIVAALMFLVINVSVGISAENKKSGKGESQKTGQSTQMGSGHQGIDSGRDFGKHVTEHNGMFSGDRNPGKHHKGYSGIKKL
jgi:hypothetical protein